MSSAGLIWADYVLLIVIGVSAVVSLFRGFVREALSLAGWIAATWLSFTFCRPAAAYLDAYVSVPSVRLALAFLALFMGVLLVTGLVSATAGLLVDKTGLSGTDRVLGMVFGAARGVVIAALLVLAAGYTPLPDDPWWREAVLVPHFEAIAGQIRAAVPPELESMLDPAAVAVPRRG